MKKILIIIVITIILVGGGYFVFMWPQQQVEFVLPPGGDDLISSREDTSRIVNNPQAVSAWNILESNHYMLFEGVPAFSMKYPKDWVVTDGGIECAQVFDFAPASAPESPIKLLIFSSCWKDEVGGERLSFEETYRRFDDSFLENETGLNPVPKDLYGKLMSVTSYATSDPIENGIYTLAALEGTLASWRNDAKGNPLSVGFALLDEGNRHQEDSVFNDILATFEFTQKQ